MGDPMGNMNYLIEPNKTLRMEKLLVARSNAKLARFYQSVQRKMRGSKTDAMVEWFNRTLEEHLVKVVAEHQQDSDQNIQLLLMAYRSVVHDFTGHKLRLPCDIKFGHLRQEPTSTTVNVNCLEERMSLMHNQASKNLLVATNRTKTRNALKSNSTGYYGSDLVWLYNLQ
ncbi:uncharacterized protein LOC134538574 [Bacillus rossius redtenbacheri]|uniref:uncharacterized protein LOC134538574 n=1 Tax=Bacillus rossius redtenbacheri TaxID=93214 RepID=UPI002FDE6CA7